MRLREVDIDVPGFPSEARNAFRDRARYICAQYERQFRGLDLGRAWKVLVECLAVVSRSDVRDLLGVYSIQILCPEQLLVLNGADATREQILEALHRGVVEVARQSGWPLKPFETARAAVLASQFVNEWTWKKTVSSPNRRWRAQLECSHTRDAFRAWLVVNSKVGEVVTRELAFQTAPTEFAFAQNFGALKWQSNDVVSLLDKKGRVVFTVNTNIPVAAEAMTLKS